MAVFLFKFKARVRPAGHFHGGVASFAGVLCGNARAGGAENKVAVGGEKGVAFAVIVAYAALKQEAAVLRPAVVKANADDIIPECRAFVTSNVT